MGFGTTTIEFCPSCCAGQCPENDISIAITGPPCAFSCQLGSGPVYVSGVVDFTGTYMLNYAGGGVYFLNVDSGLPITVFGDALCEGPSQINQLTYLIGITCIEGQLYFRVNIGRDFSPLFEVFDPFIGPFGFDEETEADGICGTYTILVTNPGP